MAEERREVPTRRGEGLRLSPDVVILKIDPFSSENFFKNIKSQTTTDVTRQIYPMIKEEAVISSIEKYANEFSYILHKIMVPYTDTGLGAIISPRFGKPVLISRISSTASMLFDNIDSAIEKVFEEIRSQIGTGVVDVKTISEKISSAIEKIRLSLYVVEEFSNRMMALGFINLPPYVRPSLANVLLGFDMIERRFVGR